ncbi:MAG: STAS domain-containing protein [Reichenbachiella sp.]
MINIDSNINTEEGYYELMVGGEVDASSSIHLDTALHQAMEDEQKIIVNLSELEYISSAGLGVFMSILQDLENKNIGLVIFGMKEKVFEVFEILGLDQLMVIKKDKDEALAFLK